MSILILSTSYNDHATRVENLLHRNHCKVLRINLDELDKNPTVSIFSNSYRLNKFCLPDEGLLSEVSSVFVHHPIIEIPAQYGLDRLSPYIMEVG